MPKEPFIARDTGEPLVVFGGYAIAKDGSIISEQISGPVQRPSATPDDISMLEKHGEQWLRDNGMFGVLDRLRLL